MLNKQKLKNTHFKGTKGLLYLSVRSKSNKGYLKFLLRN